MNNYLKQTIDNNVHSGVRRVTCFCLFVRHRISNRTAISLYFPDIFTNRKDLCCLLKIFDQRTDYVNRSSNRRRLIMNCFDRSSSEWTALSIWQRFGRSTFCEKTFSFRAFPPKKGENAAVHDFVDKGLCQKRRPPFTLRNCNFITS